MKLSGPPLHWLLPVFQGLVWMGFVLAWAGPWTPIVSPQVSRKTADVLMVLDTSLSMRADDAVPSRLESAKAFLEEALRRHPEVRAGLVVFAGQSHALVPLTHDLDMVLETLRGIKPSEGPGVGTAVGDAIFLGQQRLLAEASPAPRPKILILATDGANHSGRDPSGIARSLREQGTEFFIAGMGRVEPVVRHIRDEVTGNVVPLRDAYGQVQYWEPLDETGLKQLAEQHNRAVYVRGDDPRAQQELSRCLDLWESEALAPDQAPLRRERYPVPLAGALVCLIAEFVLARTRFRRLLSI